MDGDLPAPDLSTIPAQQTAPEPEPEPELEPELQRAPKSDAHRHEGWLTTDAGVSGGKRKRFWHALTADAHLAWFRDKDARTLFDELDRDGSGALDIDEVAELCRSLGKSLSKKEVHAALEAMDADGSGEISFEEFQPWWEVENAKVAKKREAVGSFDLSRICEASLDPEDGKKETLHVAILGKMLTLKADDKAAAKQWMAAFASVTATYSSGTNAASTELSTSPRAHSSPPIVSETPQTRRAEDDEDTAQQDGEDCTDDDGSVLDEDEDERRKLAARKRGRRGAHAGTSLESPSRDDDNERGTSDARDSSDGDSAERQPRHGEKDLRRRRRKHGKHRSSPNRHRSRSRHRRSSSRSSKPERREVDLGFDSEDEYRLTRGTRQRQLPREARRSRYTDAPRYSDSHSGMWKSRDENYAALPKGTPAPAIPLRTHTHEYEYPPNTPHVTNGYHGASVVEQFQLDDEWHTQTTRMPMSTPLLVGSGAVVSRGPNPGNHMLAEFRESFLPMQRREMTQKEERAVIIEPGAEADLNKYLRHGWRVKSTQPGTDNVFLVIVEREERRMRD